MLSFSFYYDIGFDICQRWFWNFIYILIDCSLAPVPLTGKQYSFFFPGAWSLNQSDVFPTEEAPTSLHPPLHPSTLTAHPLPRSYNLHICIPSTLACWPEGLNPTMLWTKILGKHIWLTNKQRDKQTNKCNLSFFCIRLLKVSQYDNWKFISRHSTLNYKLWCRNWYESISLTVIEEWLAKLYSILYFTIER